MADDDFEDLDEDEEDNECPECGSWTDERGQMCRGCARAEAACGFGREDDEHDYRFADPGGKSALRAASDSNPRDQKCGTCGRSNVLTREDVALGYQCNSCAEALEQGGY